MIPLETQIFRLIFPPSGSIPLEKIEAVPLIRQHIDSIIDLASTEHGISSPGESAALTARVIELRDTPGPDGKIRTWRTIAEICGTTLDAVRHRYVKGKATIRKSRTVEDAALSDSDAFNVAHLSTSGEFATIRGVRLADKPPDAAGPGFLWERPEVRPDEAPTKPTKAIITRRVDPWPDPVEPEKKPDEVPLPPIVGSTWEEVDKLLGEGMSVKDIATELEMKGEPMPWTKIRARAAYLGRMKSKPKEVKPEPEKADEPEPDAAPTGEGPQEAEATDDLPEPRSISRKELDLRIWDMWRAGKTLEEISEILYSEGLYYSAKSVRVRLLSQGAKL